MNDLSIIPDIDGRTDLSPPTADILIDVTASGRSPRELISSLDGYTLFTQGQGVSSGSLINRFTNDVLNQLITALNPFSQSEKYTYWECTVVATTIEQGYSNIDVMFAQTNKLMILGAGNLDLKKEKMRIEFNTKPRKGVGISADMFVTPFVSLTGTFQRPGVGLNKKGALFTGGAAVMTGGLSILAQGLYDRASAQNDRCGTTMAAVKEHAQRLGDL